MYFMIILEASVFPAPDSPEIMIHVSRFRCFIVRYAASAIANKCGEFSNSSRPAHVVWKERHAKRWLSLMSIAGIELCMVGECLVEGWLVAVGNGCTC